MEGVFNSLIQKDAYNYPNRFMVSWWKIYSYLNNELIQNCGIERMTATYGSLG